MDPYSYSLTSHDNCRYLKSKCFSSDIFAYKKIAGVSCYMCAKMPGCAMLAQELGCNGGSGHHFDVIETTILNIL